MSSSMGEGGASGNIQLRGRIHGNNGIPAKDLLTTTGWTLDRLSCAETKRHPLQCPPSLTDLLHVDLSIGLQGHFHL